MIDQRRSLCCVNLEPVADRFLVVIITLQQLAAVCQAFVDLFLRREINIQQLACFRACAASGQSLHQRFCRHVHQDGCIDADIAAVQHVLEITCLRWIARIAIQDKSIGSVRRSNAFFNQTEHHFVRDELAGVHRCLRLAPEFRSGCNCGSQQITGRYLRPAILLL